MYVICASNQQVNEQNGCTDVYSGLFLLNPMTGVAAYCGTVGDLTNEQQKKLNFICSI